MKISLKNNLCVDIWALSVVNVSLFFSFDSSFI